jgi:hypothetical protein
MIRLDKTSCVAESENSADWPMDSFDDVKIRRTDRQSLGSTKEKPATTTKRKNEKIMMTSF